MVREAAALIRANWLSRTSYRLRTLLSLGGVLVSIVPLFLIADALQPVMEEPIAGEGKHYFGFVLVGTVAMYLVQIGIRSLPGAIGGGIHLGTFEALLGTPAKLPAILLGMMGADLLWTSTRLIILMVAGGLLGAGLELSGLFPATLILLLILLAYIPFGLIAGALVLVFRTSGPLPAGVSYVSLLLGGVYYPTHVIPSWLQYLSDWVPLTYGLRALRKVLLEGSSIGAVAADVAILAALTAGLMGLSAFAFAAAFGYARRAGTLAQY